REKIREIFLPGERIAIKLHMGEAENPNYIRPGFVKKIVECFKGFGIEPFLFDSLVNYDSPRSTIEGYLEVAKRNGFFEAGDVVVSDNGELSDITWKGKRYEFEVCKELIEADGVLVLSHVKGHICSGFGGAIKNLGMGALTKKSKEFIHNGGKPVFLSNCTSCGTCSQVCPMGAIGQEGWNEEKCLGCSICFFLCPVGAIKPRILPFDTLLALGAFAALRKMKKVYFVNVLRNITQYCDCRREPIKPILPDIGILQGRDIVEIERESLKLIEKEAGRNIFFELNRKDPYLQIKEFERIRNDAQAVL
ncbi:MAG: hypothetical protein DRP12_02705, partial [Candidatus Aenigmatarchaeota archaeon]